MKSAAEVAQLAREAGHDVSVFERQPPPEFAKEGLTKYWAACSCGWEGRKWKAKKVATLDAIRHMTSKAADEDLAREKRRNGS